MKYFKNGSVGDLILSGITFSGVTIVEVNETYIEADDAGARRFGAPVNFQFNYTSNGTALDKKVVPGAAFGHDPANPWGTLLSIQEGYLEYQDPTGGIHVITLGGPLQIL